MSTYVRSAVTGVFLSVPVVVAFLDTVGYPAPIEGYSMRPTLNPRAKLTRDVVWVNVWRVRRRGVKAGDVVILHSPTHPGDMLVKRVVAEEGEEVETKGYCTRRVLVPGGHCWVEGDNTRSSRDSNLFGPVSRGLIFGQGTHIVWPPHRWGRLNSELLPEQKARIVHSHHHAHFDAT